MRKVLLCILDGWGLGKKNKYNAIEVAKTDGFPRLLRIKAIQSLASFNDPLVLDELIPLLESSTNYNFYYEAR